MIFRDNFLFIHVPKTGGMSVSSYLLEVLPRPVYYSLVARDEEIVDPGIVQVEGKRHESLPEARDLLERFGFRLENVDLIVATLRNPYALEVSRYAYLQKGHSWDAGHNQNLAMRESFDTFAVESVDHARTPIHDYFMIDGVLPPNLRILRTETLEEDLRTALAGIGLRTRTSLPRKNTSHHDYYAAYYTVASEQAVYERYKWVFDQRIFPRMRFEEMGRGQSSGHRLPLEGPVDQVGPSRGLSTDGWIGDELCFSVKTRQPVHDLTLEGQFPPSPSGEAEVFSIGPEGRRTTVVPTGEPFRTVLPIRLPADTNVAIVVGSAVVQRPEDLDPAAGHGGSFRLMGIRFS